MAITIRKVIELKAPIEHVWRYVGSEAGLRKWWGSDMTLEAKQGGRCAEQSLLNGKALHLVGEVTVYEPPHQLVLMLRQAEAPVTWPTCTILSITLKESDGRTRVTLEHQAFGAVAAEPGIEWTVPSVPATEPAHQVILNQLPTGGVSVAGKMIAMSPVIATSTALYALNVLERIWLREGETRCASYCDTLKQIVNEA